MLRADGRPPSVLRPVSITLESLDRVDGSAAFSFGQIKGLASVSGPIQVRLASELPSKASFEVIVRPLSGNPGTESKSLATSLRALLAPSLILTQNPRTLVQLVVQSLTSATPQPNPALMAAFVNASSLALVRASSFPMLGVVCAAAVGRIKAAEVEFGVTSHALLLDPTEQELHRCDATGCVAVMYGAATLSSSRKNPEIMGEDADKESGEIVWSSFQGTPLQSDYDALLRLAKSGARTVYNAIRDRLSEELEGRGADTERHVRKMPKHKGGRVALNVTSAEDSMDTT